MNDDLLRRAKVLYGRLAGAVAENDSAEIAAVESLFRARDEQIAKWGDRDKGKHPIVWMALLFEEIGECSRAWLARDGDQLRGEVAQVTALGLAWLAALIVEGE